jgi:thiosulfate/3-mercaptopyruvate sulfurtransferase
MLPSAEKFASDMKQAGVGTGRTVVVYDATGLFSAPRLWWMLESFGHQDALVLDGGLPKWQREGHPLEAGKSKPVSAHGVSAKLDGSRVKSLKEVASALKSGSAQVADARSPSRFRGEEPEPRPGVQPGHMPGAVNVHYATLLNADGTLKKPKDLRHAFDAAGLDLKRPIITSCGSGVTASVLMLALNELGVKDASLYDGSWAEWGASKEAIVTG